MQIRLLIVPLIVLALLLGAGGTQAAGPAPVSPGAAGEAVELETEEEGEEEESAEEECETGREELEEGEIDLEELEEDCERQRKRSEPGPGGVLPEACVVRTFASSATANPDRNTVDLTIHYSTFESTSATIAYGPHVDTAKRHLAAQGTIHLHSHVGAGQMKRLQSTHKLAVQIDIPSTPPSCKRYYADIARLHMR